MKKYLALILLVWLLVSMACSFGYEGVAIGDDPEDLEKERWATEMAVLIQPTEPAETAVPPEPRSQPAAPQGSSASAGAASEGANTYSVAATNSGCICSVDGDQTVEFSFKGDQLEVLNPGGEPIVYDKIGENTYKRSFMGYYILAEEVDGQMVETKVDEERHVVIILNEGGYIMEHYQGDEGSPCCYHTFTRK